MNIPKSPSMRRGRKGNRRTKLSMALHFRDITQQELAEALGVSQTSVGMQCSRGIILLATANRYAEVLGCDPSSLMEKRTGPEPVCKTKLAKMLRILGLTTSDFKRKTGVRCPVKGVFDVRQAARYAEALNCDPLDILEMV